MASAATAGKLSQFNLVFIEIDRSWITNRIWVENKKITNEASQMTDNFATDKMHAMRWFTWFQCELKTWKLFAENNFKFPWNPNPKNCTHERLSILFHVRNRQTLWFDEMNDHLFSFHLLFFCSCLILTLWNSIFDGLQFGFYFSWYFFTF